jgi:drug/metabolite transporter (DMT)-like permease
VSAPPEQEAAMPRIVLAAILLQIALSSGTHLAAKQATLFIPPLVLVTLRLMLSAVVFTVLLILTPGPKLPPRDTWKWLALFGLLAGPVNQGLFMYGLVRSRATHGGLLYALTPVGVYLLAVALRRERAQLRRFIGILVAFGGVTVLLLGRGLAQAMGPLIGDLFILGAVAAWVVWTTESRPFAATHGGLRTAGWSLIAGALWMIPVAPFVLTREALVAIEPTGWWCLSYLVVLASVLSYALWNFALARVDASRVAVFANLQPVATAIAAWALIDEPMGWEVAIGGALVLLGVRLAQR